MNKINWNFNNTYFNLSSSFKEDIDPVPVKNPELILLNKELASSLNLDLSKINHKEGVWTQGNRETYADIS